ncbi:MAG: hypothetical protein AAGG75_04560 [Bacteroidota bacterium]
MEISGKSYHLRFNPKSILPALWHKSLMVVYRFVDYLCCLPQRLWRVVRHLWVGLQGVLSLSLDSDWRSIWRQRLPMWCLELLIYLLECLGIGELYETLQDWVKFNTRPMYDWEIELARSVFGDSINYRRVRIDEMAVLGPRQKHFYYVSFYIINSWGPMQDSILLHELTHVWQYERMGAVYMPRALKAQFSRYGYNYGGISALKAYLRKGKDFLSFNLEQQGDIVSDYHRLKKGYQPRWGNGSRSDLPIYEAFIQQMRRI